MSGSFAQMPHDNLTSLHKLSFHLQPTASIPQKAPKMPPKPDKGDSQPAKGSALAGASLLIILQLTSRLLTFVANQLLLRYLTAPLLGLSTQLEVYYLSVLFFARESLRVAIQRQPSSSSASKPSDSQSVINLGYIPVALGLIVSAVLGRAYLAYAPLDTPYMRESLYLYAVASIIELASEPVFVLLQSRLQFGTRALSEGLATFMRCIVVLTLAVGGDMKDMDLGVVPFALGQVTYGCVLLAVYLVSGYSAASAGGFSMLPKTLPADDKTKGQYAYSLFYKPTLTLAASMTAQSVVKHILTQGDTFLISMLASPQVQGVYALANNYGGLLARLLFQPVEESSRSYFSRLLSPTEAKGKQSAQVAEAQKSVTTLLKMLSIFSTLVATFGPPAVPALLSLVAGKQWATADASDTLRTYCYYIPLMAANGLTEAFVASVATEAQVHVQSVWMAVFSGIFVAAAYVFVKVLELGATGLVLANMVNMSCRIVWSVFFIKSYLKGRGGHFSFRAVVPVGSVALACAVGMYLGRAAKAADGLVMTLVTVGGFAVPSLLIM